MIHVHALQHGSFIPQAELQELWGRIVHIEAIKTPRGAAKYAMKEAARVVGYTMKETARHLATHLDRNGGRAVHMSRGFLHGKRVREVESILWAGQQELTWIVEARHDTILGPGCRSIRQLASPPI